MAYSVTPATQTVGLNQLAPFVIDVGSNFGITQTMLLSALPLQGVEHFTPNSAPDCGFSQLTNCTYRNTVAGTYTITIQPGNGPLQNDAAQTITVIVSAAAAMNKNPRLIQLGTNKLSLS